MWQRPASDQDAKPCALAEDLSVCPFLRLLALSGDPVTTKHLTGAWSIRSPGRDESEAFGVMKNRHLGVTVNDQSFRELHRGWGPRKDRLLVGFQGADPSI